MIFGRLPGEVPRSAMLTITILATAGMASAATTVQVAVECHSPVHTSLISDTQTHLFQGAPARRLKRKCFSHPAGSVAVVGVEHSGNSGHARDAKMRLSRPTLIARVRSRRSRAPQCSHRNVAGHAATSMEVVYETATSRSIPI